MTISAIRVEVNSQLVAVAGAEGLSMLTASLGLGSGKGSHIDPMNVLFSVMGVDVHSKQPRQLSWCDGLTLRPGDRVTLEVVQVEQPTAPDQVLTTPSTEQLKAEAKRHKTPRKAGGD